MTTSLEFAAAARAYLGVPWRHQGRDRNGLDCAGLVLAAARDCGLAAPQSLYYPLLPPVGIFDQLLVEYCWPLSDPEAGAVLRLNIAGRPQHLAVAGDYSGGLLSLIHAHMGVAQVCEHRLDARWSRRLVSCWRVKGVH